MVFGLFYQIGVRAIPRTVCRRFFHISPRRDKLTTFMLSDIGEGISEVELVRWHKAVGEEVEEMETVCTVQSDKAAVDITSRYTGVVKKLYVDTGNMINIGSPLMDIDAEDDTEVHAAPVSADVAKSAPQEPAGSSSPTPNEPFQRNKTEGVSATPAVRQLAKKLDVDLESVRPTGSMGQVTREDVERFAASKNAGSEVPGKFIKFNSVGRSMVKSMVASLEVPHVTVGEDLDLTELRNFYREKRAVETDVKLTMTPFLLKGLSLALSASPVMNSKFMGDGYMEYSEHNINVAVATNHGLLVPVIHNVESKTVRELQHDLLRVQRLAAEMRLSPEDIRGGTATLSNLGAIGGTYVNARLFGGQGTIVALGAARKQPRYVGDALVPREVAIMGVTADHRHIDGAAIATFAANLKAILQDLDKMVQHY
ncbi:dihydrolipoamide branched chain E2 [Babesia ovata]|uniref:Dihydrolipoamide acetyltransferase component of pyruvate dehydrogenase complex n=1 Tax=Babesia ovata TaxID=189622 RepID=A0A2H6KFR9_9APIC|nr:dihydrolipoamide branched chain E2 [Babesia ovata]GBE61836.1 dihydrolipoamide branched chain E2 [Babesia ovata]